MSGGRYVIVDKSSGEIVGKIGPGQMIVRVKAKEEAEDKEGDGGRIKSEDRKAGVRYDRDDGQYNSRVSYKKFIKVNQETIQRIFRLDLTSTQIRLAGLLLRVMPYTGIVRLPNIEKALQGKFGAFGAKLSKRKLTEGLRALEKSGIISAVDGGYMVNPRIAVRGNFIKTSLLGGEKGGSDGQGKSVED